MNTKTLSAAIGLTLLACQLYAGEPMKTESFDFRFNGRRMSGTLADTCFTDPPYGVNYANSPKDKLRGRHRPILNDNLGDGFEAFLAAACTNLVSVAKGAI